MLRSILRHLKVPSIRQKGKVRWQYEQSQPGFLARSTDPTFNMKDITRLYEEKNAGMTPEERARKLESSGNAHALLVAALDESPREM